MEYIILFHTGLSELGPFEERTEPFRHHVFICNQKKPEGMSCCAGRGSGATIDALQKEVAARGLGGQVQITTCGSLGLCERGPNMVIYPEEVWYSGVRPEDVPEIVESHFVQGQIVERLANRAASALHAEIGSNRAKMLVAERAKDAGGTLPDELNHTLLSFMESRTLLTALELDIFSAVGPGSTAQAVAREISANPRATEMLLNALVSMGMLDRKWDIFHNTPVTARYFAKGSPDDARPGLMHTIHLWHRWSTLTDCVRAGTSVSQRESAGPSKEWTRAFIAAMHRNARQRAPLVVQAVGTEGVEHMLDVGGGSAAYSITFAQASEKLHAMVLDRPEVLSIARQHIAEAGLAGRIETVPGDLRRDHFGAGFNLVLLSAICHMLSLEENQDLLRRCFEALAPGGGLVIQDFILEADKTAPKRVALFALNMLVGTAAGSTHSADEYSAWMKGPDSGRFAKPGFQGHRALCWVPRHSSVLDFGPVVRPLWE